MNSPTRYALTGLLSIAVLSGCSSNVVMQAPTIPTPLIEKIPVSIGLRMPADFQHYIHTEEVYGREEWSIDLGNSNASLFTQLFGHMFDAVTIVNAEQDVDSLDIDALIEPSIDAFEFSVPNQSKTDAFAVWIRYRIKVFNDGGDQVANWPVSAYGKSQTASVSNSEALQRAAILAMRDAAALMILKLDKETLISTLGGSAAPQSASSTAPTTSDSENVRTDATAIDESMGSTADIDDSSGSVVAGDAPVDAGSEIDGTENNRPDRNSSETEDIEFDDTENEVSQDDTEALQMVAHKESIDAQH